MGRPGRAAGPQGAAVPDPAHANTLAYSLGGLSLISFVLMVATGIFLIQYYNPDPAAAHASVRRIITDVTGGDFPRAFHYRGAMAMIVLVGLHLLRVFVSASFKRPREGNWVIGVVLAAITAGLFFTGSVLKWDQESLEALEHNIEVGKLLGRFGFWFSDTFGGIALLTRLYVVHISVLPALFTLAWRPTCWSSATAWPRPPSAGTPPKTAGGADPPVHPTFG